MTADGAKYHAVRNRFKLTSSILAIKTYCNSHPTCKGCYFWKKHTGCRFRGKSPREWKENVYEEGD